MRTLVLGHEARTQLVVAASPTTPPARSKTVITNQSRSDLREMRRPAIAWRRRMPRPAPSRRTAATRPIRARRAASRARSTSCGETDNAGLERSVRDAKRAHQVLVRTPPDARFARARRPRASAIDPQNRRRIPSRSRMPRCLTSHADANEFGSSNARQRAARELPRCRPAACARATACRSTRSTTTSSASGASRTGRRPTAAPRRCRRDRRKLSTDVGDRRQRHHRVAEPVGRTRDAAMPDLGTVCIVIDTALSRASPAARFAGRAIAAMHPQPQIWIAAHVHLQHVGAALRELAHRVGRISSRRRHRAARRSKR